MDQVKETMYSADVEDVHRWGVMPDRRTIFLEADTSDETGGDLGISHNAALRFLKNLAILQASGDEPIVIIMNSIGGCVANGFAIYDAIRHCPCNTTIKVYGNCMSMGCVILQAADNRLVSQHAGVMFHHGDPDFVGGSNTFEVVNAAKFNMQLGDKADKIVFASINKKRKASGLEPLSYDELQAINLRGKYMSAEEAVELGLADQILDVETHSLLYDAETDEITE